MKKEPRDVIQGLNGVSRELIFRLNVFRDRDGLAFVMRVLASTIPPIQEVGLPSEQIWQDISSPEAWFSFGDRGYGKWVSLLPFPP